MEVLNLVWFFMHIQSIGADTDALTGMKIMKCIINHAVSHTLSFGKLFSALLNRSMNVQCSLGTEFLLWILTKTYTGAEYVNIFIFTDENFLPVMIRITICKTRKKRAARGKMRTNLETVLGAKHSSQHCLRTCMLASCSRFSVLKGCKKNHYLYLVFEPQNQVFDVPILHLISKTWIKQSYQDHLLW